MLSKPLQPRESFKLYVISNKCFYEPNCDVTIGLFLRRTLVRFVVWQQNYCTYALTFSILINVDQVTIKELFVITNSKFTKLIGNKYIFCVLCSFIAMNYANNPLPDYQNNIASCQQQLAVLKQARSRIAWLRLLVAVTTFLLVYFTWHSALWVVILFIAAGLAAFIYVVSKDTDTKNKMLHLERLVKINNDEINILQNNFSQRPDGKIFEPQHHAYAQDLDIFGPSSLYQYINRATSQQGKKLLADSLLQPQVKETILLRQQSVKELAPKLNWRQQFQAFGIQNPVTFSTEKKISHWLLQDTFFQSHNWKWLTYVYPIITGEAIYLYMADVIPLASLSLLLFVCYLVALQLSKKNTPAYELLSEIVPEVNTLYLQLNCFENENFTSPQMLGLKKSVQSNDALKASSEIQQLRNILNRFDIRLNNFAFPILNTFLLWDVRQVIALNDWKQKNKTSVAAWFNCIAQTELISSLASLAFNRPQWCYPVIADMHFTLQGTAIGHPLITAEKRVDNTFSTVGTAKISLVTGSNMGGKSTFLRSVGVNTVLALMGAPVCAEAFTISPVQLMSSMRVADNLAENTSTFYAELKKLESIIEAVKRKDKIFILLDEILRGTNSLDRHTGSKALVKQLIKQEAVAILATHDVELAKLENDFPQSIHNYHFDVQVANEELYFDYKLKEGICQSLNASILMKKIGIEME